MPDSQLLAYRVDRDSINEPWGKRGFGGRHQRTLLDRLQLTDVERRVDLHGSRKSKLHGNRTNNF